MVLEIVSVSKKNLPVMLLFCFFLGQRFALLVSKVALAAIVKDLVFEPTDQTPVPLRFDPGSLFVQNAGGLPLKVTKVYS